MQCHSNILHILNTEEATAAAAAAAVSKQGQMLHEMVHFVLLSSIEYTAKK